MKNRRSLFSAVAAFFAAPFVAKAAPTIGRKTTRLRLELPKPAA